MSQEDIKQDLIPGKQLKEQHKKLYIDANSYLDQFFH